MYAGVAGSTGKVAGPLQEPPRRSPLQQLLLQSINVVSCMLALSLWPSKVLSCHGICRWPG